MFTVVMLPRATRQAQLVASWWRDHRPEAPWHFERDLAELLASLSVHPERGYAVGAGRRALITRRTGHRVIYRVHRRLRRVDVVGVRRP